jgi:hypothetical protein
VRRTFFATNEEVQRLVDRWSAEPEMSTFLMESQPQRVVAASATEIAARIAQGGGWVVFARRASTVTSRPFTDFLADYPSLHLQRFVPGAGELRESWLSAAPGDEDRLWAKLARQLSRETRTGARIRNPTTGDEARVTDYRFSTGARAFARAGGALKSFTGLDLLLDEDLLAEETATTPAKRAR